MVYSHTSAAIQILHPRILTNGYYKDFGYGFYCTILEKQAIRWALLKRNKHVVNVYEYVKDEKGRIRKEEEARIFVLLLFL